MYSGVISRGIKCPIIRKGDDISKIVEEALSNITKNDGVVLHDKDVVCITEAIVARSEGNYATVYDIAEDVKRKVNSDTVGLIFPIMSRNRFSLILRSIAMGVKNLIIVMSYPRDEEGNAIVSDMDIYKSGINTFSDSFTKEEFRKYFPETKHMFTGVDYLDLYEEIAPNSRIILSNNPLEILKYTDNVIVGSIHNRAFHKELLKKAGAKVVLGLDDLMNEPINGSGYHQEYGVLGSNLATDDTLKLFPRDSKELVVKIQKNIENVFHKHLEVMVYGDGAFKDPKGGIWELADPVVSPGFTDGLIGTPNELKLKYMADNNLKDYSGEELVLKMKEMIKAKDKNLKGKMESQGTTPRQFSDLLGSLADLTSGSGDRGTPIILIQNYFNNYSDD